VSDNSDGHRPGVFEEAIVKLNQLQPDFVLSVGDLIDTKDFMVDSTKFNYALIKERWREINSIINQIKLPSFYVVGHNDIRNRKMESHWKRQFGATSYYFQFERRLCIILNSEDAPGNDYGTISADQVGWLAGTLEDNHSVRETFIFLHRPMWL
jgi:hypothetical protein